MCEESQIQGKRITVVGAGVSGRALAELAAKLGAKVFVSEAKELPEEMKKLFECAGIDYECGGNTERALEAERWSSAREFRRRRRLWRKLKTRHEGDGRA